MVFQHGCCCFDRLKDASTAAAYFTAATSIINLIINIWVLVTLHRLEDALESNEEWNFIPPGYLPIMYIELICNLCLFGLAVVLMIGVNRRYQGKTWMFTWVWGVSIFRCYEIFFGIYLLVWLGGHRIPDVLFICPQFLFIVAYWGIDSFILVFAILGVLSYWDEVVLDVWGKEKRIKYLKRLQNVRHVAQQKAASIFSGTATPRSMLMSQSVYSQPQSVSSYPVKAPRSHLPSTASAMSYHSVAAAGPGRGGYKPVPQSAPPPQREKGYPPPQGAGAYPPPQGRGYGRPPSASAYPPHPGRGQQPPGASAFPPPAARGYPQQPGAYPQRGHPSTGGGGMPRLPEEGYRPGQRQI